MKLEITLNKACHNFEYIDWYVIQHISNYYGGISYIDGIGYWKNKDHQLIKDDNRYYTVYIPDNTDTDEIISPLIHYIKYESRENTILYILDGVTNFV